MWMLDHNIATVTLLQHVFHGFPSCASIGKNVRLKPMTHLQIVKTFEKKEEDDLEQKGKTKVQEEDDHHTKEYAWPKPSSRAIPSQSHLAARFRVLLAYKEKLQEPNIPLDPHFKK